jgi:hypothetical protein
VPSKALLRFGFHSWGNFDCPLSRLVMGLGDFGREKQRGLYFFQFFETPSR